MDYSLKSNKIAALLEKVEKSSIPRLEILKVLIKSYIEGADIFFEHEGYIKDFSPECYSMLKFIEGREEKITNPDRLITYKSWGEVLCLGNPEYEFISENCFISRVIVTSSLTSISNFNNKYNLSIRDPLNNLLNPEELVIALNYDRKNYISSKEGVELFFDYCYGLYISKLEDLLLQ